VIYVLRVIATTSLAVFAIGASQGVPPAVAGTSPIYGCYAKTSGSLRILTNSRHCTKHETLISWSRAGPRGSQGKRGLSGSTAPSDLVTVIATIVLATVALLALIANLWLAFNTKRQADAAESGLAEVRAERELGWRPYLRSTPAFSGLSASVENIGRGPGLAARCVFTQRTIRSGETDYEHWITDSFNIGPDESLRVEIKARADPWIAEALEGINGDTPKALLCFDQFGTRLRFRSDRVQPDTCSELQDREVPSWAQWPTTTNL
jgi:hypothetical protein